MDSFVIFELEEVSPVSGDDEIGFAGNCTSEDVVVGKIVFDDIGNDFRCVWSSGGDGALGDFIAEVWWLTSRRVRHIRSPSWRPQSADNGYGAKLPENPANIALSGQSDK
jgi:hypothetical protein